MLKYLKLTLLFFVLSILLWINIKLYYPPQIFEKEDIVLQLNFLEKELKEEHLGDEMQKIFPEGFVFVNALYGLSWCELGKEGIHKNRAIEEALFAYNQIDSDKGKKGFNIYLDPLFGVFYSGWKNYLLGKLLSIDRRNLSLHIYEKAFKDQCEEIATAIENSETPFLQSYNTHAWPADMFLAVASLRIHDQLYTPKYAGLIEQWLEKVKGSLDPETGMLPHKVNAVTGETIMGSRGCSMTLMLRLLSEIDIDFGKGQYALYRKSFLSASLGLPSVREYPIGTFGWGDVDSGPVIFGTGFSATITGIGTLAAYGDQQRARDIYSTVNAWGFDNTTDKSKRYLFGVLPMADAFIAWGRASSIRFYGNDEFEISNWWLKFHLISIIAFLSISLFLNRKKISSISRKLLSRNKERA